MNISIRPAADPSYFNLYVDGYLAVSYESMAVCEEIAHNLRGYEPGSIGCYSEGAEVADVIRRSFEK